MASAPAHSVQSIASRLPKTELHIHLDGSLSPGFIAARAAARGISLPCAPADLRAHLMRMKAGALAADNHVQQKGKNWSTFDFCNQFLQSEHELECATKELVEMLVNVYNCWVVEIRFCPALHTLEGLGEDAAVAAVVNGWRLGAATVAENRGWPVRGGVLLCALRSFDREHATGTFRLARRWLGRGVIGADVAGDEGSYPLSLLKDEIQACVQSGVPMTVHAGEWVDGGVENVCLASELGVRRLGHGLVVGDDEVARAAILKAGMSVELCITSNCSSEKKVAADAYELHPVGAMLRNDVLGAGFSSDNLLLSGTSQSQPDPSMEIVRARTKCGLSWAQIRTVLCNGAHASFDVSLTDPEDEGFLVAFRAQIDLVLRDATH